MGLLIGLISILLCLREYGDLKKGREVMEQPVGGVDRTHKVFIGWVCHLVCAGVAVFGASHRCAEVACFSDVMVSL